MVIEEKKLTHFHKVKRKCDIPVKIDFARQIFIVKIYGYEQTDFKDIQTTKKYQLFEVKVRLFLYDLIYSFLASGSLTMRATRSPDMMESPSSIGMYSTIPEAGAETMVSIFMADRTQTGSPSLM